MKKIFLWLLGSVCAVAAIAQTVTIQVQGNRNKQVTVDGTVYTIDESVSSNSRAPIVIQGLSLGDHTLGVVNGNPGTNVNDETFSTLFRLRSGYDLQVTIRNNGAVQLKESKATLAGTNLHPGLSKTPMTASAFNTLYQRIRKQRNQVTRYNLANNALSTARNYFTTAQVEQLVSQVNSQNYRVTLVKKAYLKVTDPENFSLMYDLLNTQAGRNEVMAHVDSYNYNYGTASTSSHNAYINPMSETDFNLIYQAARNEWQANLRMNYIVNAFADPENYFRSSQARQLIQLVPAESDRLILAKTAYRGITDATNFSQVSNLLTSTASRNELAAYIRSYHSGVTTPVNTRTAMSDADFGTLYRDIESEWAPGAEMNALRKAFANTAYFFTTAQARQLIQLVSAEVNRLELAKASYRSITDPSNFSQIYDLLTSQASRNELAAYVNSYNNTGGSTTAPVKQAMSQESYDQMYRSVQNTWGLGAKMNYLTNIFANPNYYFTTAQARKLIELVSAESNRLQLAKSAYKQVVDQAVYFSQVSQVLESQSSKNELEVFIRNN